MSVQAVFGSLRWGPHTEAADLFPEGVLRKGLDEGIVWEERWVSPLAVRFSQGKIHPFFHERGPISEVLLQMWPALCLVKALCVDELTPTRLRAENRKFTNRVGGLQVEIESRGNAFDTFSWVTESAHMEAPKF